MKIHELQDYLRGQLRMAEVKIQIGEKYIQLQILNGMVWKMVEK